jgi:hypothetical protein
MHCLHLLLLQMQSLLSVSVDLLQQEVNVFLFATVCVPYDD